MAESLTTKGIRHWTLSRRFLMAALCFLILLYVSGGSEAQKRKHSRSRTNPTQASHLLMTMSPEEREMIDRATKVICLERRGDPKGSVPIDDMQARPSLPVRSPEAVEGAERAQRLLPIARQLVISSLRELAGDYYPDPNPDYERRLRRAILRVDAVTRVRPNMESRDNASVFLRTPHTITFGTIFLAGLPSDEGMISVLAHELVHIADGDHDTLRWLFRAIGNRASSLTALNVQNQRAEELTCDLVGAMAAGALISGSPSYEPLPRRLARSVEHNCVEQDDGDEDHLSPRSTIRAVLALDPVLTRELLSGREERPPKKTTK